MRSVKSKRQGKVMKNRNCCKRRRPIFTCVKAIAKIFYRKPKFVYLAEKYYRETGKDVPIRTIYFHEKQNLIVVDKPCYLSDFKARNLTKKEIAEEIRLKINAMYHKVENGEITREMATKA